MNLDKLKETARRFEQKEEWRRAIEVYQRAILDLESQGDPIPDPSVYNRVGDLQMKVADHAGAVRSYEHALELYAEQGFLNNAIALGGKILRVDSGRTPTYLRLARLHARKNVVLEVRRHLEEYLARMRRERQLPKAVEALRVFVEKDCRDAEMRAVVTDLLAQAAPGGDPDGALDELLEQLRARDGGDEAEGSGSAHDTRPLSDLVFLDTNLDWDPVTGSPSGGAGGIGPVEGLTRVEVGLPAALDGLPLVGLESTGPISADGLTIEHLGGVERDEVTFGDTPMPVEPDALIMLDASADDPALDLVGGAEPAEELIPMISLEADGVELSHDGPILDLDAPLAGDEVVVEVDRSREAEVPEANAEPEPEAAAHLEPPAPSVRVPDPREEIAAAEARLSRHEAEEAWPEALDAAAELVLLEPHSIPRYQKQVELAYRAGDRDGLTVRYLELGDALLRAGMRAPAVAVYRRVLEHHPGQGRALGALASLGAAVEPPPRAPEPERNDYVDLGALILDDLPARDSRMRVDSAEPTEPDNEDQTFREILEQFKRGIEDNLDSEDFQSHYDLGIAFKEMGLLDEAIAQFQRALRSPDGRLKASEALGVAFFEKGRLAIAEAVLSRAVAGLPGADDEKIGLIYWLGRALEAQGRDGEALPWFERALAVDIRFLDLAERIGRLGAGRGA